MGVIAALTFCVFKSIYEKLKIDDVTDQIAIHFGCGLIGTILTGFFDKNVGCFYAGKGVQIAYQLLGLLTIFLWTAATCFIYTAIAKLFGLGRIDENDEVQGIDYTQCGGSACNFSAPQDLENKPFLDH